MSDIEIKTTMQLMDEFVSNQLRCWFFQEDLGDLSLSDEERLQAAIGAQQTNSKRTELIKILDRRLNSPGVTNTTKSYHKQSKE